MVIRLYVLDKSEGVILSEGITMRYRQPSRPPVELYERFARLEIREVAGAVLWSVVMRIVSTIWR